MGFLKGLRSKRLDHLRLTSLPLTVWTIAGQKPSAISSSKLKTTSPGWISAKPVGLRGFRVFELAFLAIVISNKKGPQIWGPATSRVSILIELLDSVVGIYTPCAKLSICTYFPILAHNLHGFRKERQRQRSLIGHCHKPTYAPAQLHLLSARSRPRASYS